MQQTLYELLRVDSGCKENRLLPITYQQQHVDDTTYEHPITSPEKCSLCYLHFAININCHNLLSTRGQFIALVPDHSLPGRGIRGLPNQNNQLITGSAIPQST